uniref:DUF3081 family protein n=1 Tax=Microbulbifer agarilyticus TaxID=260552 RepID=UPI000255B668|nr:DUF3081 family protein [Microbulbifer agarilyticus]
MEFEQKIDVKQALRVFNRVTKDGKKVGDEWQFYGLTASTDFDGYTVFLRSNRVELTIFFHNKFKVECSNALDLENFVDLLKKLDPN